MSTEGRNLPETKRLENLWSGTFGDDYVERNRNAGNVREKFWRGILEAVPVRRALEVGCNLGANLQWLASVLPPEQVYGIDINNKALAELKSKFPGINAICSPARTLPFRDAWFDLTFTMGVLIHQPERTLPQVMSEIVRCSRRYVLFGEYHSDTTVEVPYRNQPGALFKRNYKQIYQESFPELQVRKEGFLGRDEGWDDITWCLFEKMES